jgi:hypothetical protein
MPVAVPGIEHRRSKTAAPRLVVAHHARSWLAIVATAFTIP